MDEELLLLILILGGGWLLLRGGTIGGAALSYSNRPSLFGRASTTTITAPGYGSYSSGPGGTNVQLASGLLQSVFGLLGPRASQPSAAPPPQAIADTPGSSGVSGTDPTTDPMQVSDPMSPYYDPTSPYYDPSLDQSNYTLPAPSDQLGGTPTYASGDPSLGGGDPSLSTIGDPGSPTDYAAPTDALAIPVIDPYSDPYGFATFGA